MHVLVVGAGVIGCAAAGELAAAGACVTVVDREGVAAGASGRNSGSVQHPMDSATAALHRQTVELYRDLGVLAGDPQGVLVVGEDPERLALVSVPDELRPAVIGRAAEIEPALADDLAALRLETGWTVSPEAATHALARRATEAGATFLIGDERPDADLTLIATGAWTTGVTPVWGVTVLVDLPDAPRHVLEEEGVDVVAAAAPEHIFSLVHAAGTTIVGSTFQPAQPDPDAAAPGLLQRAARFVPALAGAPVRATRACPRPVSPDGRPLLGRLDKRTWVATGHGPWGISIGPASAALVARAMLDGTEIDPAFDPRRFG